MDSDSLSTSPRRFMSAMKHYGGIFEEYGYGQQKDAEEFLCRLLDTLHEETCSIRKLDVKYTDLEFEKLKVYEQGAVRWMLDESWHGTSAIHGMSILMIDYSKDEFRGQSVTLKTCKCGHVSYTFEPFTALHLSIPDSDSQLTLDDILKFLGKSSYLDDFKCDKCKVIGSTRKKIKLSRLPPTLIIHLLRFQRTGSTSRFTKNNDAINIPIKSFKLPRKIISSKFDIKCTEYEIQSIINHSGSIDGGHYYAYVKDKDWYEFNDARVSTIESIQHLSAINTSPYVLFLKRINR